MKHGLFNRMAAMLLIVTMIVGCVACNNQTGANDPAAQPDATAQGSAPAAQSSATQSSAAPENTAANAPAADNSLCRIVLAKDVDMLDGNECNSLTFSFIFSLFDTLVKLEADGSLSPCLATSWEQVDDYTWHFVLREGVEFSNGEPFNAESAAYTLNYLATKEPSFKYNKKWSAAWPISVETDGEYAITLKTSAPCLETPALLTRMAMWPVGVGEPGVYEEFVKNPVGTGAYMLESWVMGENVSLVKNPNYWGEAATIEKLSYDIIKDASARSIAMQSGEYDLILGVNYEDAMALEGGATVPGMELMKVASTGMQYLFFNGRSENPFIQNPDFRKAMTYAIDHEGILSELLCGYCPGARGITAIVDNINNTYAGEGYPAYDPEKAMELAKACGYNGEEIKLYYINGQFINGMEITELIVSELQEAGFNVNMQEIDSASWSSVRPTSEYDIALNSCSGSFTGQPTDYITQVLGVSAGWTWDDTDALVSACYSEGATEETFAANLPEALKLIWERTPYLWAAENIFLYAVNSDLKGIETLATGYVRLENAYFE